MTKKCRTCIYWTGSPGNNKQDFICPVNIPQPISLAELEKVDGRLADALNDCLDWLSKGENDTANDNTGNDLFS